MPARDQAKLRAMIRAAVFLVIVVVRAVRAACRSKVSPLPTLL
jgi:hypothetical protein